MLWICILCRSQLFSLLLVGLRFYGHPLLDLQPHGDARSIVAVPESSYLHGFDDLDLSNGFLQLPSYKRLWRLALISASIVTSLLHLRRLLQSYGDARTPLSVDGSQEREETLVEHQHKRGEPHSRFALYCSVLSLRSMFADSRPNGDAHSTLSGLGCIERSPLCLLRTSTSSGTSFSFVPLVFLAVRLPVHCALCMAVLS